jgi:hypothetical protein
VFVKPTRPRTPLYQVALPTGHLRQYAGTKKKDGYLLKRASNRLRYTMRKHKVSAVAILWVN